MPNDAIDLLFDWQDEREVERERDDPQGAEPRTIVTPKKRGYKVKPWPPREVTEEELASGPTRVCSRCGEAYPETKEFYRWIEAATYATRHEGLRRFKARWVVSCRGCNRLRVMRYARSFRARCVHIKKGGERRGIEWGFDNPEDLREFWDAPCHYCGGEVEQRLGLDRVDSTKGYIPGNVVQCCTTCNMAKSNHSVDEWVAHMKKVLEHLES